MKPICLLCGSSKLQLVNKIKTKDISKIFMRLFAINVSQYFKEYEAIGYYQCSDCHLLFYYPVVIGDQLLYDKLQRYDWYYSKNKNEFVYAQQFIRPEDIVLEVGCGNGWFSKVMTEGNYVGLELNKKAQSIASMGGHTIYLQTIEEHLINASEKYDVVCSFQVLEHVENPESFLRSCINCLKPGGLLIISVPSEDSYLAIVEDGVLNMPPHHLTRWPDSTLIWMANRFNLEIISLEHGPLEDIHVHGFATEIIRAVIKRMLHLRTEIISTTVSHRFLTFICQILGNCYSKILSNSTLRPSGHSVTIVAKKGTGL